MRSGRLRHKVLIQSPAGSRDAVGERTTTWTTVATVWAAVEPLRATEVIAASQAQMDTTHRVIIRHDTALNAMTNGWRVSYDSRILVIDGIINRNEKDREIELMCTEGMRQE